MLREPTFFIDRDLGNRIFPEVLREAGILIARHNDHFEQNAPDAVWIPEVARRRWFVITHDKQIRYTPLERDAVMRCGLGMFVLRGAAPHAELAQNFVNTFPHVLQCILEHDRPFIAKLLRPSPVADVQLGRAGRVEMWLSGDDWEESK